MFVRDTYVERKRGETANDRNDRGPLIDVFQYVNVNPSLAIRIATKWYEDHLKLHGVSVLLITNDKENLYRAKSEGLRAQTSRFMIPSAMLILSLQSFVTCRS